LLDATLVAIGIADSMKGLGFGNYCRSFLDTRRYFSKLLPFLRRSMYSFFCICEAQMDQDIDHRIKEEWQTAKESSLASVRNKPCSDPAKIH